jgi:hypothetical protein
MGRDNGSRRSARQMSYKKDPEVDSTYQYTTRSRRPWLQRALPEGGLYELGALP